MDVDPIALQQRRGGRIAVLGVDASRVFPAEDLQVVKQFSGLQIQADESKRAAFVLRRRQPDPAALDHRGRPAGAGDRDLPEDVLLLGPVQGQFFCVRVALSGRTPELGPFLRLQETDVEDQEGEEAVHGMAGSAGDGLGPGTWAVSPPRQRRRRKPRWRA